MFRNRSAILRLALLAFAVALVPACDTDGPGKPGYNHAGPVVDQAVVTVTSNKGSMFMGDDRPATITITAVYSASGLPVRDLTVVALTTNIGHFGSIDGESAILLETHGGQATTVFFPGETPGTARVRAEVLGGVGWVDIRVR